MSAPKFAVGIWRKWMIAPKKFGTHLMQMDDWQGQENGQTGQEGGKIIIVGEKGPQNENIFKKGQKIAQLAKIG